MGEQTGSYGYTAQLTHPPGGLLLGGVSVVPLRVPGPESLGNLLTDAPLMACFPSLSRFAPTLLCFWDQPPNRLPAPQFFSQTLLLSTRLGQCLSKLGSTMPVPEPTNIL